MRPALPRRLVSHAAAAALACSAAAVAIVDGGVLTGGPAITRARGDDATTLAEFEAVCSKTQDAMTLSSDELRSLISRCDALKPRIDALDPSRRKVYAKRLQLCRDLYDFVLKSRAEG